MGISYLYGLKTTTIAKMDSLGYDDYSTMIQQSIRQPAPNLLLKAGIHAAHASGKVLLKRFRKKLQIREKADRDLVTNADVESEKAALKILRKAYPQFGILAEESSETIGKSAGRWIIDPLDGTANFAHGLPTFCVSIAAEWEGEVVAGVIYQPVSDETFTAIKGKGAFVNGKPISVSTTKKLHYSFLSTGFCSRREEWLPDEIRRFAHLSRITTAVRRPGAAALDLANVARGVFDGFWERGLAPWDVAAGALLIREAGGKVSDFSGDPLQLDSRELVASNGSLHHNLVKELNFASNSLAKIFLHKDTAEHL